MSLRGVVREELARLLWMSLKVVVFVFLCVSRDMAQVLGRPCCSFVALLRRFGLQALLPPHAQLRCHQALLLVRPHGPNEQWHWPRAARVGVPAEAVQLLDAQRLAGGGQGARARLEPRAPHFALRQLLVRGPLARGAQARPPPATGSARRQHAPPVRDFGGVSIVPAALRAHLRRAHPIFARLGC